MHYPTPGTPHWTFKQPESPQRQQPSPLDTQEETTSSLPIPEFNTSNLKILRPIGRGATGVVFHVRTNCFYSEEFALKVVKKRNNTDAKNTNIHGGVWIEREVLRGLNHPLLPRLRGVLETEQVVGYAIDYCPGGDLDSLRRQQSDHVFSDEVIRFYAAEMVLGLEYLHSSGIVYRDLKPDNVLIQANGHLMLIDFDLSTRIGPKSPPLPPPPTKSTIQSPVDISNSINSQIKKKKTIRPRSFFRWGENRGISPAESNLSAKPESKNQMFFNSSSDLRNSNSFVGTEEYMAPEMISGEGHNFAVDWWSLGVVLYEMRYGTTPFRGRSGEETFRKVLTEKPEMVGGGEELRDLIRRLLEKDPMRRIGVEGIKGHEFFKGVEWEVVWRIERPPFVPVVAEVDIDGGDWMSGEELVRVVRGVFDGGTGELEKIMARMNQTRFR